MRWAIGPPPSLASLVPQAPLRCFGSVLLITSTPLLSAKKEGLAACLLQSLPRLSPLDRCHELSHNFSLIYLCIGALVIPSDFDEYFPQFVGPLSYLAKVLGIQEDISRLTARPHIVIRLITQYSLCISLTNDTAYPDGPEPLSDALGLPQVDLAVPDEGDADREVAALVEQLHVVNLGHPQLKMRRNCSVSALLIC